jgi:outer membrane protein assembly factor BamB
VPQADANQDANPCLYADGLVYAAPRDTGRLRCLEAATGKTVWESAEFPVRHLLGVTNGRLIVAAAEDLRALDAANGVVLWRRFHTTVGRGVVAGDVVLWPTATGLIMLDAATGRPAHDSQSTPDIPPGQLVIGSDHLLVATADRLLSCESTGDRP